jgi:hypothetical protein
LTTASVGRKKKKTLVTSKRKGKGTGSVSKPTSNTIRQKNFKWSKTAKVKYNNGPLNNEMEQMQEMMDALYDHTELKLL